MRGCPSEPWLCSLAAGCRMHVKWPHAWRAASLTNGQAGNGNYCDVNASFGGRQPGRWADISRNFSLHTLHCLGLVQAEPNGILQRDRSSRWCGTWQHGPKPNFATILFQHFSRLCNTKGAVLVVRQVYGSQITSFITLYASAGKSFRLNGTTETQA